MLDKGQNTNDDFNQVSDSSSAELSSAKKEISDSKETANNEISTSSNALSTSENNAIAENNCTSQLNKTSPSASSALSANSKLIIISMLLIQINPSYCKVTRLDLEENYPLHVKIKTKTEKEYVCTNYLRKFRVDSSNVTNQLKDTNLFS